MSFGVYETLTQSKAPDRLEFGCCEAIGFQVCQGRIQCYANRVRNARILYHRRDVSTRIVGAVTDDDRARVCPERGVASTSSKGSTLTRPKGIPCGDDRIIVE